MAKEKKRLIEEKEQQVTMFYYEIVGSFAIIFSITVLGKLGKIGKVFTIFFKVAFGDWYWIFILFILFYGLYSLFMHNKFDFKSHRFLGFLFIAICILTYSHFPIHNYVADNYSNEENSNYFVTTWQLYRSYINGANLSSLGGGLIGSIVFYSAYYLLGTIGVILLGVIITFLGLSLLFNKTLEEIFIMFKKGFKQLIKGFKRFDRFFRYEVGKDISSNVITIKNKKISLKLLEEYDNTPIYEKLKKNSLRISFKIKEVLKLYALDYSEIEPVISYYVTTYKYQIIVKDYTPDYLRVFNRIKEEVNKLQISEMLFSIKNNQMIIQIANNDKMILSLKELLTNHNKEIKYNIIEQIPIGFDYNNNEVNIIENGNILIIGDYYVGIKNFINCMIVSGLINKHYSNLEIHCYDEVDNYKDINYLFSSNEKDIYNFLDEMRIIIDNRFEVLKKYNLSSYEDYLKDYEQNKIKEEIPFIYIIIDEIFNDNVNLKIIETKLLYISQLSKRLGLKIVYVVRKDKYINNVIYSIFDHKIIFKTNQQLVNKINNDKNDCYQMIANSIYLEGNGDAFYANKNDYIRIITPLITSHELQKIKNFYVK